MFDGSDACVAPVLSLDEVPKHPHMAARKTLVTRDGVTQPAPAPRFSRTVPELASVPVKPGADSDAVLADFGFSPSEISALKADGTVGRG